MRVSIRCTAYLFLIGLISGIFGVIGADSVSAQGISKNDALSAAKPRGRESLVVVNHVYLPEGYPQKLEIQAKRSKFPVPDAIFLDKPNYLALEPAQVLEAGEFNVVDSVPTSGGSPDCRMEAEIEVLANELTYGENGPPVPTRVDYQIGTRGWVPMYGGQDIQVGMREVIDLGLGGEELQFMGKMAWPTFDDPWIYQEFESDHAYNAAILVDGMNLNQLLAEKGIQNPYGLQRSIQEILGPGIVDPQTGDITLPSNVLIALMELGTANRQSPAFDFQDLVLKTTTDCAIGQEIMLRWSIGTDNTTTNDNYPFAAWKTPQPTPWYVIPITVSAPQNLVLTEFRGIGAQNSTIPPDWGHVDWHIGIWSNWTAFSQAPNNGNILDVIRDWPSNGLVEFGHTMELPPPMSGTYPTYDMRFDLSSYNINMLAGQSRVIGVQFRVLNPQYDGHFGWLESTENGESDVLCSHGRLPPDNCFILINHAYHRHMGRVGFEVRARTN